MSIEIKFAMFPEELAPNKRPNRWEKAAAVQRYRLACRVDAQNVRRKLAGIDFPLAKPVTAHTTFYFNVHRNRDTDNLGASIKALWDGCRDAGVLAADDSKALHHEPVEIVVDRTLKTPEIRVRLEAAE